MECKIAWGNKWSYLHLLNCWALITVIKSPWYQRSKHYRRGIWNFQGLLTVNEWDPFAFQFWDVDKGTKCSFRYIVFPCHSAFVILVLNSCVDSLFVFCRYIGHLKERSLKDQMAKDPTEVIRKAVLRMLPRNKLRDVRCSFLCFDVFLLLKWLILTIFLLPSNTFPIKVNL